MRKKLTQNKKSYPGAGKRLMIFRFLGGVLAVGMLGSIGIEFFARWQAITFWNLAWIFLSLYLAFLFVAFAFNGYQGAEDYKYYINKKIFRIK
jgi:hypothetical protein